MKTLNKINETDALDNAIRFLEHKQSQELHSLKESLLHSYESVRPINLIKNTLHDVSTSPELRHIMVNNAISFTLGYVSKKVLVRTSHSPIKKLVGTLVQFAVTSLVAPQANTIRLVGEYVILSIMARKKKQVEERSNAPYAQDPHPSPSTRSAREKPSELSSVVPTFRVGESIA
jgi:hypothetical protein